MPNESEAIRQEMDETRSSLTEKINLLEQQVVDTVHDASTGVKETIEKVKEAVEVSVEKVKDTVGDTVDSVKETFSITNQVEKRPWVAMAASAGAGFAAGYILSPPSRPVERAVSNRPTNRPGNGSHKESGRASFTDEGAGVKTEGVVENLTKTFSKEIEQLKGLAIGTLAGIVRDMIVTTVPEMMRNPLHEVFNDLTVKLGGHAVPGRILSDDWHIRQTEKSQEEGGQESMPRNPRQTSYLPN